MSGPFRHYGISGAVDHRYYDGSYHHDHHYWKVPEWRNPTVRQPIGDVVDREDGQRNAQDRCCDPVLVSPFPSLFSDDTTYTLQRGLLSLGESVDYIDMITYHIAIVKANREEVSTIGLFYQP